MFVAGEYRASTMKQRHREDTAKKWTSAMLATFGPWIRDRAMIEILVNSKIIFPVQLVDEFHKHRSNDLLT